MGGRGKGKKKDSRREVDSGDEGKEDSFAILAQLLKNINQNLEQNNVTLKENFTEISGGIKNLKDNLQVLTGNGGNRGKENVGDSQNVNKQEKDVLCTRDIPVAENKSKIINNNYVSMWKELGGGSFQFKPDGGLNPALFINKLSSIFREAEVPEHKQLSLALSTLRGSAADWGDIKYKSCKNFEDFKKIFLDRYWGY